MEQHRFFAEAVRPNVHIWSTVFGGLICAAALGVTGGCGNSLASVSGKVTLDGKPIQGGNDVRATVYFNPAGAGGFLRTRCRGGTPARR